MVFSVARILSNADLREAHSAARQFAKSRLDNRPTLEVSQILEDCSPQLSADLAISLLAVVASLFPVDTGKLRSRDILGDILRVPHASLDQAAQQALKSNKIGDPVEVGSYEFLAELDRLIPRDRWRAISEALPAIPQSDEEWLDRIGEMSLREFLGAFAGPAA